MLLFELFSNVTVVLLFCFCGVPNNDDKVVGGFPEKQNDADADNGVKMKFGDWMK